MFYYLFKNKSNLFSCCIYVHLNISWKFFWYFLSFLVAIFKSLLSLFLSIVPLFLFFSSSFLTFFYHILICFSYFHLSTPSLTFFHLLISSCLSLSSTFCLLIFQPEAVLSLFILTSEFCYYHTFCIHSFF